MIPKIKICGLTKIDEAEMLNEIKADYAGFVFFEKSKRNVPFSQAREIKERLLPEIKTVAVTVSPDLGLLEQIEEAGFHIIQIHGVLKEEILQTVKIPIWRAYNIENKESLKKLEQHEKIRGYVVDAKTAGSGKTFDWEKNKTIKEEAGKYFGTKAFILAGGLNQINVKEGIQIFEPDIVDVSSGVEGSNGKLLEKIISFAKEVRS